MSAPWSRAHLHAFLEQPATEPEPAPRVVDDTEPEPRIAIARERVGVEPAVGQLRDGLLA